MAIKKVLHICYTGRIWVKAPWVVSLYLIFTPKTNPFVRERNILRRRKKKIKPQIRAIRARNPTSNKLERLRAEIHDLDNEIKTSIQTQRKSTR